MSTLAPSLPNQGPVVAPTMDLKAVLEAQKARGGASILTPPSPATADPDAPFLREGKAPGTWVIVQMGTPINAPAVKAEFAPGKPAPEVAEPKEPPVERTEGAREPETAATTKVDAKAEPEVARAPAPAETDADDADLEAFDKIVSALKVIRGGEPMPWDGSLATV